MEVQVTDPAGMGRAPSKGRWRWPMIVVMGGLAAGLAGCDGSDDNPIVSTQLRAIHASADAPNVDVVVNGSTAVTNLAYRAASAFLSVPVGTTTIGVVPVGTSNSVVNATVPLINDRQYSAIVIGSASPSAPTGRQLQAVLIDDPANAPASGNVKLRVVHGAPGVPAVDVYVTAPNAALPAAATIAGLGYAATAPASGQRALEVPGGNYQIRATVSGDASRAVVFDSGAVPLPANADLVVVAIPSAGVSPVSLLVAPSSGPASVIADGRAAVRVAHLSPNVPAVAVSLNVAGTANSVLSLPNVSFPSDSGYARVNGGRYDAAVALASNPTVPVLTLNNAALAANTSTSVFAIGLLGGTGTQALRLAAFADDRVPVAGRAKVRVIHLAPDAPPVDVVALAANGTIATRLVPNLSYPNATAGSLEVAPGSYTLAVVPTGASTPILPTAAGVPVTLAAGQVVTVAAVGCLSAGTAPCVGGRPFQFKLFSDN